MSTVKDILLEKLLEENFSVRIMLHFLPTCKIKLRESVFMAKELKTIYYNNLTICLTFTFIFDIHVKTFQFFFFTFLEYCEIHRPFVSAFLTKEYFIGDCISAMYKNCGLEQCFMLCCKHDCRSFGHSPSQLCVVNSCTVPEKSKKRKASIGNTFQYFL